MMYLCIYVFMYLCIYVFMYLCIYVFMFFGTFIVFVGIITLLENYGVISGDVKWGLVFTI